MRILKINLIIVLALLLAPITLTAFYQEGGSGNGTSPAPGRLIVKLKPDTKVELAPHKGGVVAIGVSSFDAVNMKYGVQRQEYLYPRKTAEFHPAPLRNVFVVDVPQGADIYSMIEDYKSLGIVEYAEPDWPVELMAGPNDPLYPHQWALNNTGQGYYSVLHRIGDNNDTLIIAYGVADSDIEAQEIYDNPPDKTETVVIAIIDTGVDLDHPDLAEHIWTNQQEIPGNSIDDDHNGYIDDYRGWDFGGDSLGLQLIPDNDPTDYMGHGTHCAGSLSIMDWEWSGSTRMAA